MRLKLLPSRSAISATKHSMYSGNFLHSHQAHSSTWFPSTCQGVPKVNLSGEELMSKLLNQRWTLHSPDTKIHQVMLSSLKTTQSGRISLWNNSNPLLGPNMIEHNQESSFYIVRDDLLHPLVNGNKSRKLDMLLPLLQDNLVTDVVTCGGCQSAHAAALAVSCAERGLKSHLLLRGEQPEVLTGYNLISTVYGNVVYVPRNIYANRENMLKSHADYVAGSSTSVLLLDEILESFSTQICLSSSFMQEDVHKSEHSPKVAIVNEGAGDVVALLGLIRLVHYLSQDHLLGKERAFRFIIDAGTGTTAVGLALGAILLGLPWEITGIMLADTIDGYRQQERCLITGFKRHFGFHLFDTGFNETGGGTVNWVERGRPRKFGNVLKGEIEECQQIAQETGILVDPVYTLAAWDMAKLLCEEEAGRGKKVVMLHTGGTLGMFGLAQRYKSYFGKLKDGVSS